MLVKVVFLLLLLLFSLVILFGVMKRNCPNEPMNFYNKWKPTNFLLDLSCFKSIVDPQCCSVQFNGVRCRFVLWWNSDVTVWLLLISHNGPYFDYMQQYNIILIQQYAVKRQTHCIGDIIGIISFICYSSHDDYGKCWIHATFHSTICNVNKFIYPKTLWRPTVSAWPFILLTSF